MSTTLTPPQDKAIGTILTSGYKHKKKVTQAWLDKRMRRHRKATTRIIQRRLDAKAKEVASGNADARMKDEMRGLPDMPSDVGSLVAAKLIAGHCFVSLEESKKSKQKAPKKQSK